MERLLDYFEPTKYRLNLIIDKHQKTIGGVVTIDGVAKAETVKFHAVELEIEKVSINGKKWDFEIENGVLTLEKVPRSDLSIEVGYHGSLNENMEGAYLSTYEYDGRTEVIVATQFESHYAREAFPCIDEPAAKAVFELAITADKDDLVLSNTLAKDSEEPYTGYIRDCLAGSAVFDKERVVSEFKTICFEPTPRMSTYLLAFVIGKFHGRTVKNAHGVEITTYAALNQELSAVDFANEIAVRSLEFYDDNFGVPYPLKKLEQVALPDFEAGAMENWGLVTYRESMLLAGENATLETKKSVALTVAHELSHQWFGDLVTMEWWDDLWLNESFASVMEYYAVDEIHPEYRIFEDFFTGDCLSALRRDLLEGVQSVQQEVRDPAEIATLFDPAIVYSKGARLMLMLIRASGWQNFCKGIQEYFIKHKYGNTVGDDLWNALTPQAGFDVKKMMHAFIQQPGYPVIDGRDGFRDFTQRRFLIDGEMRESDWPIPSITEDMSGHYVLNLSDAEFEERLARFGELDLEEKLRLLIDRSLLAKTDLVDSASLFAILKVLKDEESAAVWSIIATIVAQLKVFLEFDSAEEKKFKEIIRGLTHPKLEQLGVVAREGDDDNILRMRATLLGLNFYAEDKENIKKVAEAFRENVTEIDAESRMDVLDAKLRVEPTMAGRYIDMYKKIADPEIKHELMFALVISKDKKVLAETMKLLDKPKIVKPQDQFHLFIYLFRNVRVQDEIMEWLMGHWDYVKEISGDKSLDKYPRYTANAIKTRGMYEKWCDFFLPMSKNIALKRAIEMGKKEMESRLKLIEKDRKKVYNMINTWG